VARVLIAVWPAPFRSCPGSPAAAVPALNTVDAAPRAMSPPTLSLGAGASPPNRRQASTPGLPSAASSAAASSGASGRNGLIPPQEHRFPPGVSGNPKGRPPKPATAKQLRRLARQLGPHALVRLDHLVASKDPKVAHQAAVADSRLLRRQS